MKLFDIQTRQLKLSILWIAIIILALFFTSCNKINNYQLQGKMITDRTHLIKATPSGNIFGGQIIPLNPSEETGDFTVHDWLSNNEIVYTKENSQTYQLITHNLYSGKKQLLFESSDPIVDIAVSPQANYILIHSSTIPYLAQLTVIDNRGTIISEEEVHGTELAFQWNQFTENEIAISVFQEDWSFQLCILNLQKGIFKKIELSDPFPQWFDESTLAYLQWEIEKPSLTAPLVTYNLITDEQSNYFSKQLIDFATFNDLLLTIHIDEREDNIATYSFHRNNLVEPLTFTAPLLTRYSGWVIPFFAKSKIDQTFYTFHAYRSAAADLYGDKFALVSYDLINNKEDIILDDLDNEPLKISPDGKKLLYGYQAEKIIFLSTGEIFDLISL